MLSYLRTFSLAMRRALVPTIILLIANIVFTQVTRPVGPFKQDGTDEELRNMAYNFTFALLFQVILLAFMSVIAALIVLQKQNFDAMPESVVLGLALAALYLTIIACAVMLAIRPPNFVALGVLGITIVVLTSICLFIAAIRNIRAG